MSLTAIIALALASFVWMVAPGPGVFATSARSMAFGFRSTLPFILGVVSGDLVYLLFAIFGLSMIAGMMGELFIVVRWAGAAYLIYLGGLFLTLGNPKVIIFYLSFLPTFTDLSALSFTSGVAIVATPLTVLLGVLLMYALAAMQLRRLFRTERTVRLMNRCAGSIMIGAGCAVAARN